MCLMGQLGCDDGAPGRAGLEDMGLNQIDALPITMDTGPRITSDTGTTLMTDTGTITETDAMPMLPDQGGPRLGVGPECDPDETMAYQNFVLAENCPGPCCWEFPGDQLRDDPKRMGLLEPTIHSAYHDYPTINLKSDVPAAVDGLRYYVPLAKFELEQHLDETNVGCLNDSDCSAINGNLAATCARQDGDGDGLTYAQFRTSEYDPCLNEIMCVDTGGVGGDLATQSAVPASIIETGCQSITPPQADVCADSLSMCVYPPAWVSQPSLEIGEDGRAAPEIRGSGRLFIQGINLVDTEMKAYFVRVRASDRNGPMTDFRRMSSDPVSGDVVLTLENGTDCQFGPNAEGDCNPRDRQGRLRLALQSETYTRGAGAATTLEAQDAIPPMHWYLEREHQWLRYHQRIQDAEDVDYGFAELYDDLVIVDVPKNLVEGLYAVQLSYSANTWLASLEQTFGRENACLARTVLRDKCLAAFENMNLGERQCANLVIDCDDPEQSVLLPRDRQLLTNPIYVQVAPNQVEQTYRFTIDGFTAVVSGEYGPGAFGERDRGDIWVSDDVNFFSMVVRFDPTQLDEDANCGLVQEDGGMVDPICSVSGPWVQYLHDVEPGRFYSLQDRGFTADVAVRPGEVVNVITFVFDTDGSGNDEQLFSILDGSNDLLGGVARIVAGAYGADGIGDGVAGALNGIFGATNSIIGGLNDPELIALSVTSYTAEELALLTLAAQMGMTPDSLRNTNLSVTGDKPLLEMRFQDVDYTITETLQMGETLSWGRHRETRRFETRAPGAREIGCIREELLNSCAYRGHSTYDIEYAIDHVRGRN